MDSIATLIVFAWWLAGIVLAKGFWLTVAAIFTSYGMYLVVEKLAVMAGLVAW
jgi:hypothetical protein